MPVSHSPPRAVPEAALDALAAVYRRLDRRLAALGAVCRACGRCCDFARNGYRLYATSLERALVVRAHPRPRLTPEGVCGYLAAGRCSIHPERPLGCRTFYCGPAHAGRAQELHEEALRQVRALIDRHGLPADYAPFFEP